MELCLRCGNTVERLHSLPADSLTPEARERVGTNGEDRVGMTCLMCRNEVLEG